MNLPTPRKLRKPIIDNFFSKQEVVRYLTSHGYKKHNEFVYKDKKDTAYISAHRKDGCSIKRYMVGFIFKDQSPIM